MKCPRLYYWSNIRGLQIRKDLASDALRIGSAVDSHLTCGKNIIDINSLNSLWEAKASAIITVFETLFKIDREVCQGQVRFIWQEGDGCPQVKGYIDIQANDETSFIEIKTTTRPDFYTNTYWIHDQLGTYFLSNDKFRHCDMWAIRVPMLKQTGNFRDESFDQYKERCVRDMLKRPSWYFCGYNKETKTFGLRFYRDEFDLEGLKRRYRWLSHQIKGCVEADYWYQDRTQCISPWQCDYLRVCDTGGVSEDIYEYIEKKSRSDSNDRSDSNENNENSNSEKGGD